MSMNATTNGWDVVSAVRIADVNAAIRDAGTSPLGFEIGAGEDHVTARFDPWHVDGTGDGVNLRLRLPLRDIDVGGAAIGDASALVSARLRFAPAPETASHGRDLRLLMLDAQSAGPDGAAQILKIDYEGARPAVWTRAAIEAGLEDWLNANLHRFAHVFACVDLTPVQGGAAFEWLRPSVLRYAVVQVGRADLDKSLLGILCQTAGRTDDDLQPRLSPGAVPDDARAALLISPQRVVEDMLKPAVPMGFKGLDPKDLKVITDPPGLRFRGDVPLEIVEEDGKTYEPYLRELSIDLEEDKLSMTSRARTRVFPGIWSCTKTTAAHNFTLTQNKAGEKTLELAELGAPETDTWKEHEPGVTISEKILIVIGAVAAVIGLAALTITTAGLGTVAVGVSAGVLIGGAVSAGGLLFIKSMDAVAEGDGPPLDLLLANAGMAVEWAHGETLDPTSAGFNGAFQIAGTLRPAVARKAGGGAGLLAADAAASPRAAARAFQARFGLIQEDAA